MPVTEENDIPSNFNTNDWIKDAGFSTCDDHGASTAAGDEGKLRFDCEVSHLAYDDPIVYPGQPGAAHLHHFFGNTLTNYSSTYSSLRSTGDGTCAGGPINRTGYWFPAMIRPQNNKVVKPNSITIYYTHTRQDTNDFTSPNPAFGTTLATENYPRGFKYIFGWKSGDVAGHSTRVPGKPQGWSCTDNVGNIMSSGFQDTIQDVADDAVCPSDGQLYIRVIGPECWDGNNLDTSDHRSHVADKVQDGFGNVVCPATHLHQIPQLTVIVFYSHNGEADFTQWYIASDQGHGSPDATHDGGATFHTDWFGAWDTPIIETWLENVLGVGTPGGAGDVKTSNSGGICEDPGYELLLTNDLTAGTISTAQLAEGDRYLDIPPVPQPQVTKTNKGRGHKVYTTGGWR